MKICKNRLCGTKSLGSWASLCLLFVVFFFLYNDPSLILWGPLGPADMRLAEPLPLDLAVDSIDDMYAGCQSRAASIIYLFGVQEWHMNRNLSFNWFLAGKKANKPKHKGMTKDHAVAVYLYTKDTQMQENFDNAVKVGKNKYSTDKFTFHYFYFHLTDAVQILHQSERTLKGISCRTVYLRTERHFQLKTINTTMRFGAFVLATLSNRLLQFNGNVTCFEIYTCFGADISYYSSINQFRQVLIPTYEVFKVKNVTNHSWCSIVYTLQSTKTPKADLNCKLNHRVLDLLFETDAAQRFESSLMSVSVCLILVTGALVLCKHRQIYCAAAVLATPLVFVITVGILRYPGNQ